MGKPEVILVLACLVLVVATTAQDISIPIWLHSFGNHYGGPYFIMVYSSLCFAIFFTFGYIFLRYTLFRELRKFATYTPPFWENIKYITAVGVLDALNGIIIIYASDPERTPPVLQPVLGNSAIIWSILLSKFHVTRKRKYLNIWVVLSIVLVIAGVGVMVGPVVAEHGVDSITGVSHIGWISVFILGVIPGAWYNVMQQRVLDHMRHRRLETGVMVNVNDNDDMESTIEEQPLMLDLEGYYSQLDIWFVLSISCIIQLFVVLLLIWVNFIPWFGFGTKLHLLESVQCYFGYYDDCHTTWWVGLVFLSSYILTYFTSIVINETSANYNEFVGSLIAPLSVAFWYLFPEVVEAPVEPPPLWAAITALVLLTISTMMWRLWERHQDKIEARSSMVQDS